MTVCPTPPSLTPPLALVAVFLPTSYIVMTYCESGDLSAAIKEQRRKGARVFWEGSYVLTSSPGDSTLLLVS